MKNGIQKKMKKLKPKIEVKIERCIVCSGHGRLSNEEGYLIDISCSFCKGTGEVEITYYDYD